MALNNNLLKFYRNFAGLDLRSPDISQQPEAATEMMNAIIRPSGAISKRKGAQLATKSIGGYGATTFDNVDDDGDVAEEFLTIDENLYKLNTGSYTITYSPGDSTIGSYEVYYDEDDATFYFDLYDSTDTRVLHYAMGNGYSGTNRTFTELCTAISAVSDFAAVAPTTAAGENATFTPVTADKVSLSDGVAATLNFVYYTEVDKPSTYDNPFSAFYALRTNTNFENATFTSLNQVLYIAAASTALHKYDGLRVYKAGLPKPTTPTDSAGGGGSLFYSAGEVYKWKYTYTYIDAKGNQIESEPSETTDYTTTAGSESRTIVLTNLQETSGYNVSQAVVNGNQTGVNTITVDSTSGLKVGDYVYLLDGVTSTVVSRKITAIPNATTFTIAGDAVNVLDNAVISCILITLYRTNKDGTLFYVSKELMNDTDNNTQSYDDGTADASLGAEFVEPIKPHGLPPQGKYIRAWRSQLVISGTDSTNTVYYSDIENPEYFPEADNSFTVSTKVTGIREHDAILYVFKEKSIDIVSGDFGVDQFQVDTVSNIGIGCAAHATIQEVNKTIWFLANDGIYALSGSEMQEMSKQIKPRFVRPDVTLSLKQSIAYNWVDQDKYMIYIPNLTVNPTYSSDDSKIYVFDYGLYNAWSEWNNFNYLGGISALNNALYFVRRVNSYQNTLKVSETQSAADYLDHDQPIEFTYRTHWETAGEPAIFKKFLRLKVYSLDPTLQDFEMDTFQLTMNQYGNFLVDSIGEVTLDFSGGNEGWGEAGWGEVPWGESLLPDIKTKLNSSKLRSVQFKFSNSNYKENVLLSGYEVELNAGYKTHLKE